MSLFDVDSNDKFKIHQDNSEKENSITSTQQPSIKQILQLVSLTIFQVESFQKWESSYDNFCGNDNVLLFTSILEWLNVNQGIKLDDEQQMAYEVICSSFLLKLLDGDDVNDYDGISNVISGNVTENLNKELRCLAKDAEKRLSAHGGENSC